MRLFDSHCHLQFPQYADDLPEVLARMREHGMGALVIGTDYGTSKAGVELVARHDFLWAAVGLHPNDNPDETFDATAYEALAAYPKVVAIGECGLDYFRSSPETAAAQKTRFLTHVALAEKLGKPLVIHCRNAHDDMLAILAERRPHVPVIIHFFTGSGELAQKYVDLGCYLSFPGPITYTDMYDESIRICPLEKMLIETDAPFAAPVPYRGRRNEPSYVEHVAAKVAAVKGLSIEEVAARTAANAAAVFSLQK